MLSFRGVFLFADNVIFFTFRFCALVKEMLTDAVGSSLELEGEIDGDTLEVSLGQGLASYVSWAGSSPCCCWIQSVEQGLWQQSTVGVSL